MDCRREVAVMARLSRFVLRYKLAVLLFWVAVLAVGVVASARLSGRLSAQSALPGAASYQVDQQILRQYGNGGPGNPDVVVVRMPPGWLVTGAALILFFTFAALSIGPETDLKVMATALGAAILRDATVARGLLVPTLTAVLGPANWLLPRPARRLLGVLGPPEPAGPTRAARAAAPAMPGE